MKSNQRVTNQHIKPIVINKIPQLLDHEFFTSFFFPPFSACCAALTELVHNDTNAQQIVLVSKKQILCYSLKFDNSKKNFGKR